MIDRSPASRPWLIVVSDRRRLCAAVGRPLADAPALLLAQAEAAAAAGATAFQVRERDLDARALYRLVQAMTAATAGRLHILVNDRADVAAAAGAGVHLRANSIPAERIRRWLPTGAWITQSVHDRSALAAAGPVDAVVAGAVFATASKPEGHRLLGLAGLADLVAASPVPVVAIGGLTAAAWPSVRRAGAVGIAAIGVFLPRAGESIAGAVHRAVAETVAVVDSPVGGS